MRIGVCSERFVWRRLSDGGAFVVDLDSGDHLVLNATAADFLDCIGAGAELAQVRAEFRAKYAVGETELEADLRSLSAELSALGLITTKAED